mmetsp:Transcript_52438/g.109409  ORF Transcript_52438/g.109409 Transcript_52438/m.109409 type:complete len:88 (+) Transcript_52438:4281-4544(+)
MGVVRGEQWVCLHSTQQSGLGCAENCVARHKFSLEEGRHDSESIHLNNEVSTVEEVAPVQYESRAGVLVRSKREHHRRLESRVGTQN